MCRPLQQANALSAAVSKPTLLLAQQPACLAVLEQHTTQSAHHLLHTQQPKALLLWTQHLLQMLAKLSASFSASKRTQLMSVEAPSLLPPLLALPVSVIQD